MNEPEGIWLTVSYQCFTAAQKKVSQSNKLTAGAFHFVAHGREFIHDDITMIALNFDIAILDGSPRATKFFELLGER